MQRQRGFTLVEVIVATVIIAIIAAIAIPSYAGYVARANRSALKSILQEIASKQESWLADRKSYAELLTELGYPADTLYLSPAGTLESASGADTVYTVTLDRPSANVYTLSGAPQNIQATRDQSCGTLSLASNGTRTASGSDGVSECWK